MDHTLFNTMVSILEKEYLLIAISLGTVQGFMSPLLDLINLQSSFYLWKNNRAQSHINSFPLKKHRASKKKKSHELIWLFLI